MCLDTCTVTHNAMSKYPSMNWNAPAVADTLQLYKQRLLLVCEDNDVTEDERIGRKIKIGVGDEELRRLNASGLSDVEQKTPAKLCVAPSPTMINRTKYFRDILLFIVDQNLLSVGDGLRSHPSLHKHRKNCEIEIMLNIMDNMQ